MNSLNEKRKITQKVCVNCKENFSCGMTETDGTCWCNELPPIFELKSGKNCLCPKCLKEEAIEKIRDFVSSLSPKEAVNNKASHLPKNTKLMKDIDFYIEHGNYVFTAWYHLKRGSCCENGCRHCPYGFSKSRIQ